MNADWALRLKLHTCTILQGQQGSGAAGSSEETTGLICVTRLFPYWKVTCCNGSFLFLFFLPNIKEQVTTPHPHTQPHKTCCWRFRNPLPGTSSQGVYTNTTQTGNSPLSCLSTACSTEHVQHDRKVHTSHAHLVQPVKFLSVWHYQIFQMFNLLKLTCFLLGLGFSPAGTGCKSTRCFMGETFLFG